MLGDQLCSLIILLSENPIFIWWVQYILYQSRMTLLYIYFLCSILFCELYPWGHLFVCSLWFFHILYVSKLSCELWLSIYVDSWLWVSLMCEVFADCQTAWNKVRKLDCYILGSLNIRISWSYDSWFYDDYFQT